MKAVLTLLLEAIRLIAYIVPRRRRPTWYAQWRADLWHYHSWLERQQVGRLRASIALVRRSGGTVPHALVLRFSGLRVGPSTHDFKFASRMIVRRPAFAAVAVLILGLAIGANATVYSWMENIVLQPVPAVDVSPLLALDGRTAARDDLSFSYPNFIDLRASAPAGIDDLFAFRAAAMSVRGDADPRRMWGQLVTANFFDVLRVTPILGRGFSEAAHGQPGGQAAIVLSNAAWRGHFAGDPSIVGRAIAVNGRPFTVIGIAPERFRGTVIGLSMDVFVPIAFHQAFMSADRLDQRGDAFLQVQARLAPGASLEQVQASLDVLAARLASEHPAQNAGRGIVAKPLWKDGAAGMFLPVMAVLMAVGAIVLLVACANLAVLLLARAARRQREIAVRLAVGASRAQLVRQFMIESLLLAITGGCAGVVLSTWTSGLLRLLIPPTPMPIAFESGLSLAVVGHAMVVTFVAVLAFGLVPALRASRADIVVTLKDVRSASPGASGGRMRNTLVTAQVALSLLLLVCAALFGRAVMRAQHLDTGFSIRDGVIAAIDLPPNGYDSVRGTAFHRVLLDRLAAVPGVASVTVASNMPLDLGGTSDMRVSIDGYHPPVGEEVRAYYNRVGPHYFETMGIDIVSGRPLDARDGNGQELVVVVNETMAGRYWPGENAVGRTLEVSKGRARVVGVARDGKYGQLGEKPRNFMYVPLAQVFRHDALLIVRTAGNTSAVMSALQALIRELDPNLPLFDVRTVREHLGLSVFIPRMTGTILALLGVLALVLAVVGLYGVIAFGISERRREIGIRMALGGTRQDVTSLLLRQGLALIGVGVACGVVLAVPAAQALRSQLVGVAPGDPVSFVAPALILFAVALAACAVPALRATKLDPARALLKE